MPSSGVGRPVPPKAHLPTVHVRERYGLIWICPGEPVADIPRVEAEDDPSYRRINSGVERWTTSVTRMTDNFLDIAHFPWVHTGTFGIQDQLAVPPIELEQLDDDFYGYRYDVEVANTAGKPSSGLDAPVITRRMTTGFHLPFTVRSTIHYETGLDHLILLCSTPIDDVTSYFTFVIWRNDDFSVPGEEVIAFDRAIGAEDKVDARARAGRPAARPAGDGQRAVRQAVGRVAPAARRAARGVRPAARDCRFWKEME